MKRLASTAMGMSTTSTSMGTSITMSIITSTGSTTIIITKRAA